MPVHAAASHLSEVEFHPGFTVDTGALDPAYRGSEYVTLAAGLAGTLTPDVLGDAARSGRYGPQSLKKVWQLLARYGRVVDTFEQGPPATKLPRTGRRPPAEVRRNAAGPP